MFGYLVEAKVMRKLLAPILLVLVAAVPAGAVEPTNDDPSGATIVSAFPATLHVDTTDATTGPFEEDCYSTVFGQVYAPVRAVWFRLELPSRENYVRVIHDDEANVVFWNRIATAPNGEPVLTRSGCAPANNDSAWPVYSMEVYLSVGSTLVGESGPFEIEIEVSGSSEPTTPANDVPYRATVISSLPYVVDQDATNAQWDSDPQGCPGGAFVWYSYTPQGPQTIEVSVISYRPNVPASVTVYALGNEVRTLGCDLRMEETAVVVASLEPDVPALIGIGGNGALSLIVRNIESQVGNPDDRSGAIGMEFGADYDFDTSDSTMEPGEPESCGSGGSLWFALPVRARDGRVDVTAGVSVAAVAGDSVLECSTTGKLRIPADSPATHLQVRSPSASGTLGLRFDPAFGVQVTDASPYSQDCGDPTGIPQVDSEVEVSQAVDPHNPNHLLVTWQQDRYLERGGARGIGSAVSFDGGKTWTTAMLPGITVCDGGDFQRATDPWAAIGGDGVTYVMSLGYDPGPKSSEAPFLGEYANLRNAVLISRSEDGGRTWGTPNVVAISPGILFNDKETLTADPNTPGLLYATWGIVPTNAIVPVFARSEDGGRTWTPPIPIPNTGSGNGDQIAVLDDGTIVSVASRGPMQSITSRDRGVTWSRPSRIAAGTYAEGPPGVRGGAGIPSVATDGKSVFVSWSDTFATFFARSGDAGTTWNVSTVGGGVYAPPSRSTTAVAGTDAGRLVVMTYFVEPDFRTTLVMGTSGDGGESWSEQPVTDVFDFLRAPDSQGRGRFLGDYFGLSASGDDVVAAFAAVPPGDGQGISNVYSLRITP